MADRGLDNECVSAVPANDRMRGADTDWHHGSCDSLNLDGTKKPSTQERGTYGHAQKMRASMTYAFGKLNGLGNMPWHESDAGGGVMFGNPSISVEVSSFMCSLRRRKVIFSSVPIYATS